MKYPTRFAPLWLVLLSVAFSAAIVSCSKDPVSPVLPPAITSFTAIPTAIHPGDSVVLVWKVDNGVDALTIDNGVGSVKALASVTVHPTATTTYRLVAANSAGSDTASVTVTLIGSKPTITFITVTPAEIRSGESAQLSWNVVNSPDDVIIDNGVGSVKGLTSVSVQPTETTTYRLIATNAVGSDTASVTLSVIAVDGPTEIAANSRSESSIGVAWHRQPSDVTPDTVLVSANGALVKALVTSSVDTTAVVDGLSLNTLYTITVASRARRSGSFVTWAPSIVTQTVRVYETDGANATDFSGVVFNGLEVGQDNHAVAVDVRSGSSKALYSDLVLSSDPSNFTSQLTLVAPAVTSLSGIDQGKYTKFSNAFQVMGGMDNIYYTGDLRATIQTSGSNIINAIELPAAANAQPLVFNALTADGHFARIEVLAQASNGGKLFGGTAGQHYVDLKISYQPIANAAYASRPLPLMKDVAPIRWHAQ